MANIEIGTTVKVRNYKSEENAERVGEVISIYPRLHGETSYAVLFDAAEGAFLFYDSELIIIREAK